MGHAPEDLPRTEHHRRMAEPAPRASSSGSIAIIIGCCISVIRTLPFVITVLILVAVVIVPVAATEAFFMKLAHIYQQSQLAGVLEERDDGSYRFTYELEFHGEPVSLTMPTSQRVWEFPTFPAPFEGLLPEGVQLDALLRLRKLDRHDLFGQLLAVGNDVVGSLRIEAAS
jgi:serine/threonine-protein kinase HipA